MPGLSDREQYSGPRTGLRITGFAAGPATYRTAALADRWLPVKYGHAATNQISFLSTPLPPHLSTLLSYAILYASGPHYSYMPHRRQIFTIHRQAKEGHQQVFQPHYGIIELKDLIHERRVYGSVDALSKGVHATVHAKDLLLWQVRMIVGQ